MLALEKFVIDWNTDGDIIFLIPKTTPGRIDRIEVRFSPDKYLKKAKNSWQRLIKGVDSRSDGLLTILTNEVMYGFGVIELKINHRANRDDVTPIINTLKWIGGSLLA